MFTRTAPLPGENFWSQIPNHWIRDHRLTAQAYRVLSYWGSHAVGYRVSVQQTQAELGVGRDAIYAAVKVLLKYGYVVRRQPRNDAEKFGKVEYEFGPAASEQQYVRRWGEQPDGDVSAGQTASGFSASGTAVSGESATKKTRSKKISSKKEQLPPPPPFPAADSELVEPPEEAEEQIRDEQPQPGEATAPPEPAAAEPQDQAVAEVLDDVYRTTGLPFERRPRGRVARTIAAEVARHLTAGWPSGRLAYALSESLDDARSPGGVLLSRLTELGAPPPAHRAVAPAQRAPREHCPHCQNGLVLGYLDGDDRMIACPQCCPDGYAAQVAAAAHAGKTLTLDPPEARPLVVAGQRRAS